MSIVSPIIRETKTEYDRKHRQWLAYPAGLELEEAFLANAVEIFPAGREGERAARLAALEHDAPALALLVNALILAHPHGPAIDRLLNGARLAANGRVYDLRVNRRPPASDFICAYVGSQSHPGRLYTVTRNLTWQCTCADHDDGRAHVAGLYRPTYAPHVAGFGVMCKHCWSVELTVSLAAHRRAYADPDFLG